MKRCRVGLVLVLLLATLGSKCGDNKSPPVIGMTRIPSLRVVPDIFFQAEADYDYPKHISELGVDLDNPFLSDTLLVSGPSPRMQAGLGIINDGPEDIAALILVIFIKDFKKFIFGTLAGSFYVSRAFELNPSPAMLDVGEPMYFGEGVDTDPYPGFVGYVPIGSLKAGESTAVKVTYGAAPGTLMHYEAVGIIREGVWAVPVGAKSGTSIALDELLMH